ncbi:DMT family transporter [Salinisphaera aquimarina]|uniref:Guanidinium exporter n=1 Tax=Salinisphaera aquimarina TaxID=2094031 RepID=A0ABV7ELI8_9GAMM
MKTWIWLLAAAATEVGWVCGVKAADSPLDWAATIACIMASFVLALAAARQLPATTVYVIFVGLGALGTAVLDILAFGAALHASSLAFLALLLSGVIGLKLTASDDASRKD